MKFALQVMPITFFAAGITWAGMGLVPDEPVQRWFFPLLLLAILLYAALPSFKEARGWNVVLLLGFAFIVGLLLRSSEFPPRAQVAGKALAAALLLLGIAAVVGKRLGRRLAWIGPILWVLSLGYFLGWAGIVWLRVAAEIHIIWSAVGLFLFSGLAAAWFAGIETIESPPLVVTLAMDLYILTLNLALAGISLGMNLLAGSTTL